MQLKSYYKQSEKDQIPADLAENYKLGKMYGVEEEVWRLTSSDGHSVNDTTALSNAKDRIEAERDELRELRDTLNTQVSGLETEVASLKESQSDDGKALREQNEKLEQEKTELQKDLDDTRAGRIQDVNTSVLAGPLADAGGSVKIHGHLFSNDLKTTFNESGKPVTRVVDANGNDRTKKNDDGAEVPFEVSDLIQERAENDAEFKSSLTDSKSKTSTSSQPQPPSIPGSLNDNSSTEDKSLEDIVKEEFGS